MVIKFPEFIIRKATRENGDTFYFFCQKNYGYMGRHKLAYRKYNDKKFASFTNAVLWARRQNGKNIKSSNYVFGEV